MVEEIVAEDTGETGADGTEDEASDGGPEAGADAAMNDEVVTDDEAADEGAIDEVVTVEAVTEDVPADSADDPEGEDVDQLFAKLRAESTGDGGAGSADVDAVVAEPGDDAEAPLDLRHEAGQSETDEDEPEAADPRIDPFGARDEALTPLERTLQRQLKRVLADDQNGVLDRLRTVRGKPTAERVLAELDDLTVAAGDVSSDDLMGAYRIGVEHIGGTGGDAAAVSAELGQVYERLIAEPLRAAVVGLLDVSDDVDELSEQVRAAYRTFRTEQLAEVSAHVVAAAYARGRYDAIDADTEVVWLQDPQASSPDCEDNELAGVVTKGTVFPTGSECAPAYEGCRCLVIPAALAPAPTEA